MILVCSIVSPVLVGCGKSGRPYPDINMLSQRNITRIASLVRIRTSVHGFHDSSR